MKLCFPLPESAIAKLRQIAQKANDAERFDLQLEFERLLNHEKNATLKQTNQQLSIVGYVVPDNSFKDYCVLYLGKQYTIQELNKFYNERVKNKDWDFSYLFSMALNSAYIGWLFSNAEFWQDLKLLQDHARNSGLEDMGYLKNFTDIRSEALASIIDSYFASTPVYKNIFKNIDTLSIWPVYPEYACFCKKWRLLEMASNFFPISINMLNSDDVKTHDDLCYPEAPPTVFHYYFDEKFKKAKLDDERLVPKHLREWASMMQGVTVGINKALKHYRNLVAYIIIQSIEDRIKPYLKISNNIIKKILADELCLSAEASYRILKAINDARNSTTDLLKSYIPIMETESYAELIRRMKENWFCVDDSIKLSGVYPIHGVTIETDPKTNEIILKGNVAEIQKAADDFRTSAIDNLGKAENTIYCALILDNDSEAANLAGKSRDTVRRYKCIFFQGGPQALKNQMRDKPLPSNRVRPELEEMVLQTALENPKLGRYKISSHILENFNVTISPSTVQSILSRYNLMSIQQRAQAQKEHLSASSLINAQNQDDSSTAFGECSMEDIIETFLANPKITRTELVNLLHEKYGVLFEPEKLAGLIQHCARFIQKIRLKRTPIKKRPGLHMTAKARRKAIKSGLVLPFWGEITKSTPLDITD